MSARNIRILQCGLTPHPIADRVCWFRERANCDRWTEEVELLECEFDRTIRSFTKMSTIWADLAKAVVGTSLTKQGMRAYAWQQVTVYTRLEEQCRELLVETRCQREAKENEGLIGGKSRKRERRGRGKRVTKKHRVCVAQFIVSCAHFTNFRKYEARKMD